MHITKVELENIKSHAGSTFEFSRGTTAITGENGAGKTTIIEAIAWTLFDVLDYKKEDFVRRGEKKGVARVTFESSLDDREYTVYRDTATGYNIYDPKLKVRIADKKEEVGRFLWQHLGAEAGTDLESLFRRAVGVPQGTFTAIFLDSAAERKKAFDKLLKVEEYRRGADELLKTARYIDQGIAAVNVKIARAEGELARLDALTNEQKTLSTQAEVLQKGLEKLELGLSEKLASVALLDQKETALIAKRTERDAVQAEHAKAEIELRHYESGLAQARDADEKLRQARPDADRHASALARLKELERERGERERLRLELAKVETAAAAVKNDQKHAQDTLENGLNAHKIIESLKPHAPRQESLESKVSLLRDGLARTRDIKERVKSLGEEIQRVRERYRENRVKHTEALEKAKAANAGGKLRKRETAIVRQLAELEARLDHDRRFQNEIRNGLCPILSQKCLNLKDGETLESFVNSQFKDLRSQITALRAEHFRVSSNLKASHEAEKSSALAATLAESEKEMVERGQRLRAEYDALEKESAGLPQIESDLAAAENELAALDNPVAKIRMLEKDVSHESELRHNITKIEQNLERLESDRRIFVEQLESYKDLDSQLAEATEIRDRTEEAHKTIIANEAIASTLAEHDAALKNASAILAEIRAKLESGEKALVSAAADYDRERHLNERAGLLDLQRQRAEVNANFETANLRVSELSAELERLSEVRNAMKFEFIEKERLEKVAEATTFIRDTLKEAAPLVARNYVHHVSLEANQMFREITGNAEHTLKWAEDYGIVLEEGGYDRPFNSFSGGEQMAAALSVRLALLKQLSDIRIAFFDEPTASMDTERRENLAMEISRITHFDQLFIISHDDAFDAYVDNVVSVEKP